MNKKTHGQIRINLDKPNQKWCTDFTYLFLKNGDMRYICTTIDLHDRSVVASITNRHITQRTGIRTAIGSSSKNAPLF